MVAFATKNKNDKKNGWTDESAVEDEFHIEKYIEGLTAFIGSCNTPMTIAIQGDWGTGKTSIMQMVNTQLIASQKEKTIGSHTIWFNTWQYSQFNLGDKLALSLMKSIVDKLSLQDNINSDRFNSFVRGLGNIVLNTGYILLDHYAGGEITGQTKEAFEKMGGKSEVSVIKVIESLKKDFQDCINQKINESSGTIKQVVVFIDDLDRLEPIKAVELLESLKIFLDCKNCVFVLAIDYSVVTKGIKEKYGNTLDEEKGKYFFDKIIQVPFKMPTANYVIDDYVKNFLNNLEINYANDLSQYVDLIKFSIGRNPRSMKRLFNTYSLLNIIKDLKQDNSNNGNENRVDEKGQLILFATLCMQMAFEEGLPKTLSNFSSNKVFLAAFVILYEAGCGNNKYFIV